MSTDRVASAFLPGKIEKHRNNQRNDQDYDQGFGYGRLLQWNIPPLAHITRFILVDFATLSVRSCARINRDRLPQIVPNCSSGGNKPVTILREEEEEH